MTSGTEDISNSSIHGRGNIQVRVKFRVDVLDVPPAWRAYGNELDFDKEKLMNVFLTFLPSSRLHKLDSIWVFPVGMVVALGICLCAWNGGRA